MSIVKACEGSNLHLHFFDAAVTAPLQRLQASYSCRTQQAVQQCSRQSLLNQHALNLTQHALTSCHMRPAVTLTPASRTKGEVFGYSLCGAQRIKDASNLFFFYFRMFTVWLADRKAAIARATAASAAAGRGNLLCMPPGSMSRVEQVGLLMVNLMRLRMITKKNPSPGSCMQR